LKKIKIKNSLRYLSVKEKLAPVRLWKNIVVLKPNHGRQSQHFRAQHEHTEHWHQRKHAYHFTIRLQACNKNQTTLCNGKKNTRSNRKPVYIISIYIYIIRYLCSSIWTRSSIWWSGLWLRAVSASCRSSRVFPRTSSAKLCR